MAPNYGYALDPGFKTMLASVGVRHEDVLRRADNALYLAKQNGRNQVCCER